MPEEVASSVVESLMKSVSLTPSKVSPPFNLPGVHVGPLSRLPLLPLPDTSTAVLPDPSSRGRLTISGPAAQTSVGCNQEERSEKTDTRYPRCSRTLCANKTLHWVCSLSDLKTLYGGKNLRATRTVAITGMRVYRDNERRTASIRCSGVPMSRYPSSARMTPCASIPASTAPLIAAPTVRSVLVFSCACIGPLEPSFSGNVRMNSVKAGVHTAQPHVCLSAVDCGPSTIDRIRPVSSISTMSVGSELEFREEAKNNFGFGLVKAIQ